MTYIIIKCVEDKISADINLYDVTNIYLIALMLGSMSISIWVMAQSMQQNVLILHWENLLSLLPSLYLIMLDATSWQYRNETNKDHKNRGVLLW